MNKINYDSMGINPRDMPILYAYRVSLLHVGLLLKSPIMVQEKIYKGDS